MQQTFKYDHKKMPTHFNLFVCTVHIICHFYGAHHSYLFHVWNCVGDFFFFWLDYKYTSLTSTLSFCKRYCGVSGKKENVIRNITGNTIIMHGNNEYSTYAPAVNDIKVPIFVLTSSSAPSVPRILKRIQQGSNNLLQRDHYHTYPLLFR